MFFLDIDNFLCEYDRFSVVTCFNRLQNGSESAPNRLIMTWWIDYEPASYLEKVDIEI